ncbi:response regulator transcription factor [Nostoc sp. FACHB-87]|uniref:response regulator n=1 Tax=Nostocaceae TaxID=1162 RepID=UPI0016820657|nr:MULTISPECIES: response regulator transcription factor [Nostocaceae]MBD2458479.1 response regulator transcription factor [Nostoc sp. FACHB-87]MBD2479550.1 response regulator transcription factor [Anabaena sp. FACHB-83]
MLTIVIVEKEPFTLLGIKTALAQTPDIKISGEANCGKIGFQLVEQNKPNVVLVDLFLPDMSGLEFTRSIKKKTDSKVVILTNQTDEEVVDSAFIYGADSYMLKTTDIEVVQLAIKKGSMLGYLDYASVVNEGFQGQEMEKVK